MQGEVKVYAGIKGEGRAGKELISMTVYLQSVWI